MKKLLLFLLLIGTVAFNYGMEQSSFIPASWMNTAAINANIHNQAAENIQSSDIVKAIKVFACHHTGCEFCTPNKGDLRPHLKTHTKDSDVELPCDFPGCEYKTYNTKNLYAHKKSRHSNEIYVCNHQECTGYVTDTQKKLTQHQVIHTKDSGIEFHCSFSGCPFTNYSPLNISAHERRAHKNKGTKRKAY